MPFFFIVPLWFLCVLTGCVLLFFAQLRRIGQFVIAVPTGATGISFLLSTAALFLLPRIMPQPAGPWYGIFTVSVYLVGIVAGGLIGAVAAFFVVLKLQRTR